MKLIYVLLVLALSLTGCVHSNSNVKFSPSDPAAAKSNLSLVKIGKTTQGDLVSIFGAPSSQTACGDGQILRYNFSKETSGSFSAPFVDLHDNKQEQMELYFEIKNDVVAKFWRKP